MQYINARGLFIDAPYTLHPTLNTLHPTPYTLHPTLYTLHTPYTIHHTPYTIHHTPYPIHHTRYTINPNGARRFCHRFGPGLMASAGAPRSPTPQSFHPPFLYLPPCLPPSRTHTPLSFTHTPAWSTHFLEKLTRTVPQKSEPGCVGTYNGLHHIVDTAV